ncbi:MAG: hypothetical protein JST69_11535 [Bacteroidetes bacterium]|nr:hypothetical protein [Bacteroidota bacterium]
MRLDLLILVFTIGTAFSQGDCNKYSKDYIPKNLNDALDYMDCVWKDKEVFKNKSEEDAVADAHFTGGQWIRNDWELWKGKNSLYKQFKSLGVTFPEDISSIILISFHRRLNHKDIDLSGQIQQYNEHKKQKESLMAERSELGKNLKIGDAVNVVFSRNAIKDGYYLSQMAYTAPLDRSTNCFVEGKVISKKKIKGSYNLTIEVTNSTNCENSNYEGKPMTKGQTFSYNMTYFNLRVASK